MFVQCQQFLKDALKDAGIHTPPITSLKKLTLYTDSHVGAILFDEETLGRSGSKRIFRNERGDQQKRRKVYDRSMTFDVIIGEYTAERRRQSTSGSWARSSVVCISTEISQRRRLRARIGSRRMTAS